MRINSYKPGDTPKRVAASTKRVCHNENKRGEDEKIRKDCLFSSRIAHVPLVCAVHVAGSVVA